MSTGAHFWKSFAVSGGFTLIVSKDISSRVTSRAVRTDPMREAQTPDRAAILEGPDDFGLLRRRRRHAAWLRETDRAVMAHAERQSRRFVELQNRGEVVGSGHLDGCGGGRANFHPDHGGRLREHAEQETCEPRALEANLLGPHVAPKLSPGLRARMPFSSSPPANPKRLSDDAFWTIRR